MLLSDRNFLMKFLLEGSEEGVTRKREAAPAEFEAVRGKISKPFFASLANLRYFLENQSFCPERMSQLRSNPKMVEWKSGSAIRGLSNV
jgi:hypothetical protein